MIKYNFNINSHPYQVEVENIQDGKAKVCVNGQEYEVLIEGGAPAQVKRSAKTDEGIGLQTSTAVPASPAAQIAPARQAVSVGVAGPSGAAVPKGQTGIPAPLPGTITEVLVRSGQSVIKGERVLVLESMKIGNDITSPRDGVVKEILVSQGDSVQEDDILVIIG